MQRNQIRVIKPRILRNLPLLLVRADLQGVGLVEVQIIKQQITVRKNHVLALEHCLRRVVISKITPTSGTPKSAPMQAKINHASVSVQCDVPSLAVSCLPHARLAVSIPKLTFPPPEVYKEVNNVATSKRASADSLSMLQTMSMLWPEDC